MTNRKQPFGYHLKDGEITIQPTEAELVQQIFVGYLAGMSFKALADKLEQQTVRYDTGKAWNKNMIARMLEDQRYTGAGGCPLIIEEELYASVTEKRQGMKGTSRQTAAEKAVRQLAGQSLPKSVTATVLSLLNQLIQDPGLIKTPPYECDLTSAMLRRELDSVLLQIPVDEDRANELLRQCAMLSYQAIDSNAYETQRLRRIFSDSSQMKHMDIELLHATVTSIMTGEDGSVSIRLKNHQIFEGVKTHEKKQLHT